MKRTVLILTACAAACIALATPRTLPIAVTTGSNTAGTNQTTAISGWIEEIVLDLPTVASGNTATGTVAITATPVVGGAVTLASATITADTVVRLRLDATGTGGSALSDDPPVRYYTVRDNILVIVSDVNTSDLTWNVLIKYDDGR